MLSLIHLLTHSTHAGISYFAMRFQHFNRIALAAVCLALVTTTNAAEPTSTFYNLPRASHITIDGKLDDWSGKGFFIEQLALDRPNCETKDHAAWARIAWDRDALLLAVRVWDDALLPFNESELGAIATPSSNDSILVQFSPLPCEDNPLSVRFDLSPNDQIGENSGNAVRASKTAFASLAGGYGFEAAFPWNELGVEPQKGLKIGFQLSVNDIDPGEPCDCLSWRLLNSSSEDQFAAALLRISTQASNPCGLCIWEQLEGEDTVEITLQAPSHHDGDKVAIMKGETVLAESIFVVPPDQLLAEAHLALPRSTYESNSHDLAIAIADEPCIHYRR